MADLKEGSPEPATRWWETALASTALAVGCTFFVGHEAYRTVLHSHFGYAASPLSIYSYDDVLMNGAEVLLTFVAPRLLPATLLAIVVRLRLPSKLRRRLGIVAAIPVLLLAIATPMPIAAPMLDLLYKYRDVALKSFYVAAAIIAVEWQARNLPLGREPWARLIVPAFLFGFTLWLTPQLLSRDFHCFPQAAVRLRDGGVQKSAILAVRDGFLILGRADSKRVVMLPQSDVLSVDVGDCP